MSLEDPFFMVREEVQKALKTSRGLYDRWCELLEVGGTGASEEYEWTLNELRNSLRSIEWDLEDLEETVGIVEKNPRKFKIGPGEIQERRKFIENARSSVKQMKDHLANPRVKIKDNSREKQSLLHSNGSGQQQNRYHRLDNDIVESNQRFIDDMNQQQQVMIKTQDTHLENIGTSVGVLKDMSHRIHNELEEQSVMLDEFGHEMDNAESKMDTTMKKIAKVLHMSNDRRQWCAIGILLVILIIIIILFATLP
ncbi:syntaxin-6 [Lingula anatina]|uniref:Syntaxin-6 n=1 Tax=Lingula anatina TaxID=7574 RepID=A0A1S3IPI8_LINAN|nr:syntaxin-6 [Lingula anatina]|eukprot:XP_013400135.1 syntaxin-6 [Lingula anatina]